MISRDRSWVPAVAAAQAGVFSVQQAQAGGLSRHQVAHRLHNGTWTRIAGRALVRTGDPVGPAQQVQAAGLCWPDAVVCLGTAARLHRLPVPDDGLVHVNVPSPRQHRGVLRVHSYRMAAGDVVHVGAGAVTTRERTIIDCVGRLPAADASALIAWTISRDLVAPEVLAAWVVGHPRTWGNVRRRSAVDQLASRAASPAEQLLQDLLRAAGIGGWTAGASLLGAVGVAASADIWFADVRLVIEVDGQAFHGASRFQDDRTRQNLLVAAGCTVLRYTWHDLTVRSSMVVAQIRANLARLRGAADRESEVLPRNRRQGL
jgi:very-short-patch-repair endonuclease